MTLGGHQVWPHDIATYAFLEVVERDWDGQWLCFAIYFLAAGAILTGVLGGQLDVRFLIAVTFLAAIAAMSVADALAVRAIGVYRLEIVTHAGERIIHATPSLDQAVALVRSLDALARSRAIAAS
jgi:hypothetical protein